MKIKILKTNNKSIKFSLNGEEKVAKVISTRPVYIGDTVVIKFSENLLKGNDGGETSLEKQVWKRISKNDRKYFPRLLKATKEYVIVERKKLKSSVKFATYEQMELVGKLAEKYSLYDVDSYRGCFRNWALDMKSGLPCIYDYGEYDNDNYM